MICRTSSASVGESGDPPCAHLSDYTSSLMVPVTFTAWVTFNLALSVTAVLSAVLWALAAMVALGVL